MAGNRNQFLLKATIIVTDILLLNVAFLLSYWMRYVREIGGEVSEQFYVKLDAYLLIQVAFTGIMLVVYTLGGLYRKPAGAPVVDEMVTILAGAGIGMMLTLAFVFVYQGYAYSRWLFFFLWALILALLSLARVFRRLLMLYLRHQGIGVRRVLVVGADTLGRMVMHVLSTEPRLGYQLVGFVQEDSHQDVGRFKCLGQIDNIGEVVREHRIDEVIIALPSSSHHNIPQVTAHCQKEGLGFRIVPDLYEMSLSRVDIDDLRGIPLIGIKRVSIQGLNLWLKRGMDILFSLLLLILLSPLWALTALLIKLDSSGPVVFRQTRIGKEGKPFQAYKFRSMKESAEEDVVKLANLNEASWPLFKMRNDPRVTRVGHILRRTSLDELPQLLNVLRGEMSLVGPRPPILSEVEMYEEWHKKRLGVAPGITGLWQVSGRSELPFDEMVMLDVYYIENWSLGLDFQILLRTIPAVISGRGAY